MIHGSLSPTIQSRTAVRKTPESFLGPNSNLVNLDALVSKTNSGRSSTLRVMSFCLVCRVCSHDKSVAAVPAGNPFAGSTIGAPPAANPFQAAKPAAPTINQLRSQGSFPSGVASPILAPTPFGANSNLMGSSGGIPLSGNGMGLPSNSSNPFSL